MKNKITKLSLILAFSSFALSAQTKEDVNLTIKDYDLAKLNKLAKEFSTKYKKDYERAVGIATAKGLPLNGVDGEGRYYELVGLKDGTEDLKYYVAFNSTKTNQVLFNNSATNSSIQTGRVQHLHNGGSLGLNLEGQGVTVGEWDGGAVYAGHVSIGASRVTNKDNSNSFDDHATHVAGTMIANNQIPDIKGMAPQGMLWSNNFNNDLPEMTTQAGEGLILSNHSYGANYEFYNFHNDPTDFGRYTGESRNLDLLLYTADKYLPVYAAGNGRNGLVNNAQTGYIYFNTTKGGDDLMHGDAVSKNAVVVAAINGITEYTQPSDVIMSDFSQWGPTDDFRIKPDISAKGVSVKSSITGSSTATDTYPGTSMAAPAITGVFALWQQYHKLLYPTKGFMRAATVKALMAISADEAGSYKNAGSNQVNVSGEGPDHRFGWGVINAKRGAEILRDSKPAVAATVVTEAELANGATYEITVITDGSMPLKAAISWTDPAGNIINGIDNVQKALVNDLDLRIIRPNGTEVLPWALNKSWSNIFASRMDNDVDPLEVVDYRGPVSGVASAGTYTIRVTHKGQLVNGTQKFSLIVYGISETASTENNIFDNLNVYPNPTNDYVTISADLVSIAGAKIKLYDVVGKLIYSEDNLFYNTNSAQINLAGLNSGVYMLNIENGNLKQTVKVVKK